MMYVYDISMLNCASFSRCTCSSKLLIKSIIFQEYLLTNLVLLRDEENLRRKSRALERVNKKVE